MRGGRPGSRNASVAQATTSGPAPPQLWTWTSAIVFHRAVEFARQRASRDYLVRLMRLFGGNVNRAAAHAAMTRESLYRVLRQFDVQAERYKPRAHVRQAPRVSGGSPLQAVPAPSADRG